MFVYESNPNFDPKSCLSTTIMKPYILALLDKYVRLEITNNSHLSSKHISGFSQQLKLCRYGGKTSTKHAKQPLRLCRIRAFGLCFVLMVERSGSQGLERQAKDNNLEDVTGESESQFALPLKAEVNLSQSCRGSHNSLLGNPRNDCREGGWVSG